jgi:hypothetical protein
MKNPGYYFIGVILVFVLLLANRKRKKSWGDNIMFWTGIIGLSWFFFG